MNKSETILKKTESLMVDKDFRGALKYIESKSLEISKKDYYYLKSVLYRYLNKKNEALLCLDKLIQIEPTYGRAFQEFGHNFINTDPGKSLKSYLRAVRHNPSLQASWLGILSVEKDNQVLIDYVQENVMYLKSLPPELKSVLSFIHEGKYIKADSLCRSYLQKEPHDVEAMRLLAKIGTDLYIYDDAEFLLESSLIFEPSNIKLKFDYITILIKRQKYAEALHHAKDLYSNNKDNINAKKLLATTLFRTDDYKKSLDLYDSILEKEPNNTDVLLSKGHLYKTSGDIPKSISSYQQAYKSDKYFGDAYWSLANLKTYKFSDDEIGVLSNMVVDPNISSDEKVFMHFSLGKAFEDRQIYKDSFKHYQLGNNLKKDKLLFKAEDFIKECKNQIEVCTSDLFNIKRGWGIDSAEPIFILGLPRVGSTLVEQILASHSQVEGTHELPNIISTAHKLNQRRAQDLDSKYPDILLSLSEPELKAIGNKYIEDAKIFRTDKPFFIDKMPNNFRHIGLIKLILPNAKIIDIRRSSMSACFSSYKQLFAEGQDFTYDLKDLATYYNNYVELMDHWNSILPGEILSLNYEDLINDFEPSVDRILDYCNLPFEQSCLEFYKSKRSVKTPSAEQVRQPIYRSGMDHWKNYEPFLDDLKNNLTY
jgi:tetratricopeptide (TPR) repeat protein|tara:strand:+ start:1839 stop:3791 length:1953 start_codon:yes stop_codon:yes gene_type:complete